ncbi:MAG: dihydrolipoyl dehydrogenase [Thermoleophilia bacterium]|nr:dihydrolipoyl dehydrogenase [Thermoleophilia bacterium]
MECDVAVLGGGPAGYTAAIRAAQLGGKVVCIEQEPELGGTCLRVGCIPTKAWVQTAHALHDARETFAKLGVGVSEPQLDFPQAAAWKDGVVAQMTGGVAGLLKANGVEWVRGTGRFTSATTIAIEGGEDVTCKSAIVATGSYPMRPPIPGLDSPRCVDSTGLLSQTEVPHRLVVLGGGIIGCEFASIFAHFGSEVTIVEMLPTLIPQEDEDAAKELKKAFKKRGIAMHLEKQCTGVDDLGDHLAVHFGDGESVEADLMLVAVGRAPSVKGLGLEEIGIPIDPRSGIATDDHMRTAIPTIFAAGDVAGRWQRAHTAFREGEIAAENAMGHEAALGTPSVPRPIYTDPEIAGVGLTETQARERYGDAVAVGVFPWVANARAVMSGATAGWVKSIHETTYGELLGLVIVGPHATDLIEVGVVAIDAESTVETVADGIAPHPTLSEAIKEAGLVALGRAIHLPPKRR